MKLIDRIKQAEQSLEARLEEEKRQIAEAQRRLDDEERQRGREEALKMVKTIDAKILVEVDERKKVMRYPIGRGRTGTMSPFETGFSEYLVDHYTTEGLDVTIEKLPLSLGQKVTQAYDFNLHISWLNK